MTAVIVAAPAPIFVDTSQGTPGFPSPTGGVMTIQGQAGMYPVTVTPQGAVGVTGPVQVYNNAVGQPLGVTGPIQVFGQGVAGGPTGGVISTQVPDTTTTGTLGALNATVQIALVSNQSVACQLAAGTLIGTIVPELSFDGGTTWNTTFFDSPINSSKVSSIVFGSANPATGNTIVGAGGASHARVRVSAYTSGTANCSIRSSQINDPSILFDGPAGVTGVIPPATALVGGSDGTTLRSMLTDTAGRPVVVGPGTIGGPTGGVLTVQGATGGLEIPVVAMDNVTTGALGSLNANVQVITTGLNTAGFQLAAGTLIGTIIPEVSFDNGTTWNTTFFDTAASGKVSSIVFSSSNVATAATIVGVGGSQISRVRVSAFTSGTANITVRATTRLDPSVLFTSPTGTANPPAIAMVGGSDGPNLVGMRMKDASTPPTLTDPALVVNHSPVRPYTYTAVSRSLSPTSANPTDIFTITGSATRTIRVTRMWVAAIQTTAASQELDIMIRSTANTGGTSTTSTNVPCDSTNPTATATVRGYTVNPTGLGTLVGIARSTKFFIPAGGTVDQEEYFYDFTQNGTVQGEVLRGTTQVLSLNWGNGAALTTGLNLNLTIEWTEE